MAILDLVASNHFKLCPQAMPLGFPGVLAGKNLPGNAGDTGSIPGSGRSFGEGMATHSSILAWEILWTEGPGGLHSPRGCKRVGHN